MTVTRDFCSVTGLQRDPVHDWAELGYLDSVSMNGLILINQPPDCVSVTGLKCPGLL